MPSSRIDCVNIRKINCEFYDENRLCPDVCAGFRSVETTNQNTISVYVEEPTEQMKEVIDNAIDGVVKRKNK